MIKVVTDNPIAYDSPDHIVPWGTMRDNTTDINFIVEIEEYHLGNKINYLDLGCSGGQLAVDFHERGHISVGLEGSDYSLKNQRANWPKYANKVLFTCDITKPYKILSDDKPILFDVISAWEVVEHIHPDDLEVFFTQISNNLKPGGIFVGSVATSEDIIEGIPLHQSVFSEGMWYKKLEEINKKVGLTLYAYPFKSKVREDWSSFHILLKK